MKEEIKEIEKREEEKEEIYDEFFNYSRQINFLDNGYEYDVSSETVKGEKNNNYSEENEIPFENQKTGIKTGKIFETKEELINDFKPKINDILIPDPSNKNQKNGNILENEIITEKENISKTRTKKALGRKRKNSEEKGIHNKYCEDNILRKIKSTNLFHLINFQ